MSVCGQNGQTEEDSGDGEEVTATAAAVRDIYKQKPASKVVRVLTVLAYLLSVSLAAILLSVYYVCVWKPPVLPPDHHADDGDGGPPGLSPQRGNHTDYTPQHHHNIYNNTGGSDSTVNALVDQTMEPSEGTVSSESTTNSTANLTLYETTPSMDYTDEPLAANDTDIIT